MTTNIEGLKDAVVRELGPTEEWATPAGYPDSLALCVIDSIQSIGQRYSGVRQVVQRYRDYRREQGGDATTDGSRELWASFVDLKGVDGWIAKVGTGNRVYARKDAPFKATVIRDAAQLLMEHAVFSTRDLLELTGQTRELLEAAWRSELMSQRSGLSWRYLVMVAGGDGVKPDRMVLRFLARHLPGVRLGVDEAADLVTGVAARLGVSAYTLDHRIWLHERAKDEV